MLKRELLPKLFGSLAKRYLQRPGGYTRVHKLGNRPGDNAPIAIVELVDNPRDLQWETTARSIGWELLSGKLSRSTPFTLANEGFQETNTIVTAELKLGPNDSGVLRPVTRRNLQKILYEGDAMKQARLVKKVKDYMVCCLSSELLPP